MYRMLSPTSETDSAPIPWTTFGIYAISSYGNLQPQQSLEEATFQQALHKKMKFSIKDFFSKCD